MTTHLCDIQFGQWIVRNETTDLNCIKVWGVIPCCAIIHFQSPMFPLWPLEKSTSKSPAAVTKGDVS